MRTADRLELHTERLDLAALDPDELKLYLEQPARLEQALGFPISRSIVTEQVERAIRMKLAKMSRVEPGLYPWYTYWLLVIQAIPFGAGLIGFKGFPDENGEAEIGYGIDPAYQGQGFTTEAVRCMIGWAFEEAVCLSVVARDTKKSNTASLRVLAKAGMVVYQDTGDALYLRVERDSFRKK